MITRYSFSNNKISAILVDGYYIWVAYINGGTVYLDKVSIFNPYLRYFRATFSVNEITRIKLSGDYLYLSVDSTNYIGIQVERENPLTGYTYINKPVGITEKSIDLALDSNDLFLLIPGEESGEYTKILKYDQSSLTLTTTIELSESGKEITNSRTMTIDDENNLWIATYTDPISLVKVYEESGEIYSYEIWEIN